MEYRKILVLNPGSTSTKIAVYEESRLVFLKIVKHSYDDLKKYERISDQFQFRKDLVLKELESEQVDKQQICIIMGRGGLIKPVESGVYEVNQKMLSDLSDGIQGEHASNLGGLIAYELAKYIPSAKAYIADPVVVDELMEVARITGHPLFRHRSVFHALNQKAIARAFAQSIHKKYEDLNLIVAHLGGGISVGAHRKGKVVDVNQALDGDGPLSPERSGTLPVGDLIDLCFSGKYDHKTIRRMVTGEGGYVAYFGTNDARKVEEMAMHSDSKAIIIQETLSYQVAKYIGAAAATLEGNVDAILLTGGLAYNNHITKAIIKHISFITKVYIYPGEDEMKALAQNALMVLNHEIMPKEYI